MKDERRPEADPGTANDDKLNGTSFDADVWRDQVLDVIAELAGRGREFTADDVRAFGVGEPDHLNRWGSAFSAARKSGLIAPVGTACSRRPVRHAGLARIWVGAS